MRHFILVGSSHRSSASSLFARIVALLLSGCGPGTPAGPDAAPGDVGTDTAVDAPEREDAGLAFLIAPPTPPTPPSQLPCPTGWVSEVDEGVTLCLPWPDGEAPTCVGATYMPPGEDGCVDVGDPCPAGDFPDGVAGTEVAHVRPGAAVGDGSRDRPYGSLDQVPSLPAGSTIVLSRGVHEESQFQLPADVTVRGACTAETILTRSASGGLFLAAGQTGSVLSDLTIRDVPGVAVVAYGGGELTVTRVVIERARQVGLRARTGSTLSVSRVAIRDTRGHATSSNNGMALSAEDGSTVTVARAVFEASRQAGVVSSGEGTTMTLEDVAVLGSRGQDSDSTQGHGALAQAGARIAASRSAFVGNRFAGVSVATEGVVACDYCFIADTRVEEASGEWGEGVQATGGGDATLTHSVIQGNTKRGVWSAQEGTTVSIEDSIIRDVHPQAGGEQGRGLHTFMGGSLEAYRVAILRTVGHAVTATSGSRYVARDVIIRDVDARALDGEFGRGFSVVDGSEGRVTRATVDGHSDLAVMVGGGAEFVAEDLRAGPPVLGDDRDEGRVFQVQEMATGTFTRVSGTGWRYGAVTCLLGSTCTLRDASFRDGNRDVPTWVRGLVAAFDAIIDAERIELTGLTSIGALAIDGAALRLRDVSIRDVARCEQDCLYEGGTGIAALQGGSVTAEGFTVMGGALCGVHIFEDAALDLREGVVSGSEIGICLQAEGYDLNRLQDQVLYENNGVNLDSVELPVPEPPTTI